MTLSALILKLLRMTAAIDCITTTTGTGGPTSSIPWGKQAATAPCLNFKKKISLGSACPVLFFVAMTLSLLGTPLMAVAGSGESKLQVSVTILKHASLQVMAQPTSVLVTEADIARGYVDVPSPAQVAVQSNTQGGYVLMFESQGEFLRQTLVKGLGTDVQLSASGGGVTQRGAGRGMSKTLLDLGFRFVLSESARQGVYAWPMRLSVTPL